MSRQKDIENRIQKIIGLLEKEYPNAKVELDYDNPLELLVATILSAQCTDKRVNIVTKDLFKRYKTAKDYADADQKEVEDLIKSTGFYRNKARNIIAMAKKLVSDHDSKVPKTMEELITLQGVARKTANVVLSGAYGIAEGIAVDTHVKRLSGRLGLSKESDPDKIEQDLLGIVPKDKWSKFNNLIVWHGRRVCMAKNPNCEGCTLKKLCPSAFKT